MAKQKTEEGKHLEMEHKEYHRRLSFIVIVMAMLLFGGATFYHRVEKWSYLDAIYFSTATLTTIGYGDIVPKTDLGKIFTIVYAFTGVAIALYGLSLMASHFVEKREEKWLQRIIKLGVVHKPFLHKIKQIFTGKNN